MQNINKITTDEAIFLQITEGIADFPKSLWCIGKLPDSRLPTVAIVGTRKPTTYGKEVTYRLSYELASRGVVIVSGLAFGIDGIAHQAALDAGGITLAVLPTSVDKIYPASHRSLAKHIVESGGALLSEYDPGATTYKGNFIARNRIVTAISDGLLITEAAERSGTLSTANFALCQGKSVMVVPGNITSPMSAGCNRLLKVGAAPIVEINDILHELGWTDAARQTALPLAHSPQEQKILQLIAEGIRDGQELQIKSRLAPAVFSQTLTLMEINGVIRALGANQWGI